MVFVFNIFERSIRICHNFMPHKITDSTIEILHNIQCFMMSSRPQCIPEYVVKNMSKIFQFGK
jgi:hypothetical protein